MQHSSKWIFFWMSIDFFQRLTTLKGTYFYQMSCTRDNFSAKISLKDHFWRDLIGVWKITLLSKDPTGWSWCNTWMLNYLKLTHKRHPFHMLCIFGQYGFLKSEEFHELFFGTITGIFDKNPIFLTVHKQLALSIMTF